MFQGLSLRTAIRTHEPIFDGRTLSGGAHNGFHGDVPCRLLHKVTVCKPASITDSENGLSRNIKVTPRHDVNELVDLLLRFNAPALDQTPRGEYCPLPRGKEVLLSAAQLTARQTRTPWNHPRDRDFSHVYDRCIDEGVSVKAFTDPTTWYQPNTCVAVRPKMVFVDSDMRENERPLLRFRTRRGWRIADYDAAPWLSNKKPKNERLWQAKALQAARRLRSAQLVCVKCGENFVERFGDGFVLCDICETSVTEAPVGWKKTDWEEHFDFAYKAEHQSTDYSIDEREGFAGEPDHELTSYPSDKLLSKKKKRERRRAGDCTPKRKPKIVHSNKYQEHGFHDKKVNVKNMTAEQPRYVSANAPYHFLSEYELSKEDRKKYFGRARPLLEEELAWILAIKFKGFTRINSDAYLKARRAAAQLSAHFIFGRGFAEIARMTQREEPAVEKFCKAARADYQKYLKKYHGRQPSEAAAAMRSGMLRSLYNEQVTMGHQCRSRNCCAA